MNNVDIAISEMRKLQEMIFDYNISPNDLFKQTTVILEYMNKASVEIQTNYEEISEKLTKQLNTGRVQK